MTVDRFSTHSSHELNRGSEALTCGHMTLLQMLVMRRCPCEMKRDMKNIDSDCTSIQHDSFVFVRDQEVMDDAPPVQQRKTELCRMLHKDLLMCAFIDQ
ncbi:uncharacterized [Tachysurus ichikawai]